MKLYFSQGSPFARKVRNQARVSAAVSGKGRQVRPAASARWMSRRWKPARRIHTGMSRQPDARHSRSGGRTRASLGIGPDRRLPAPHLAHGDRLGGTAGVEDAGGPLLGHADGPFGQVAGIDELHRIASVARHQDLATAAGSMVNLRLMQSDSITPANSDYLARADDRGGRLAVLALRFLFARRLQRTVELRIGVQRLDGSRSWTSLSCVR